MSDFDKWYWDLEKLAEKHGESVRDEAAWREEGFEKGQTPEESFYEEYPEHISKKGIAVMEDYQKRVVAEKTDLDDKITKLRKFISNREVDTVSRKLMERQVVLMELYSQTLDDRIDLW